MKWKDTGTIVDKILYSKRKGIKDSVEKIWESLDSSIRDKAKIVMLKNDILILEVKNNADLQDISFKREFIKNRINGNIRNKITGIKLRLGG